MANDNADQGYVPLAPPGQRKQVTPIQPTNSAASGDDQGYVPLAPAAQRNQPALTPPPGGQPSGWGVDWRTGNVTMPQSVQDWGTVAGQEAGMGLPGLRAQAAAVEAARQRLGPAAAGTADLVGGALSPSNLLIPFLGPEAAGAAHEGIKSAVANWKPDESWTDYAKNVSEDTAGGAAIGLGGRAVAAAAPVVAPVAARVAVQGGIPTALGAIGHQMFGQGDVYRELMHMAPEFASIFALDEAGKKAAAAAGSALSSPATQQAIKSLVLGGGSAARQGAGPYDQWMTGP
jgi:hypothetical protein